MFDSPSRNDIRNVSADFCAAAGEAPAPSKATARNGAPNLNCTPIPSSLVPTDLKPAVKHTSCQMALHHSVGTANHRRWRHTSAAVDRDAAARVEAAAVGHICSDQHVAPV